ncbi:MAG: FAD-dependent oxidoreductase [Aeromonas sp.]
MQQNTPTARRRFLSLGLKSAALAPLAASALPSAAFAACTDSQAIKWDEEMDILVVGSGIAGSSAAIRAAETTPGLKIVVADKMSRLGGTSLISGLNMAVVGSPWQKEMGVTDDSWELLYQDIAKEAKFYNHPELTEVIAKNSLNLFNFLTSHGVEYDKSQNGGTGVKKLGGHNRPRVVWPVHGGTGVIKNLHKHIKNNLPNVDIRKQVKLDEIFRDDAGRVIGVKVREGYFFNRDTDDFGKNDFTSFNNSGTVRYYKVKRALVMATGGYNQDRNFRSAEVPVLHGSVSTANPGATAGALKAMMDVGFKPIHMTLFRFAFAIPTEDINWGILVNPRTCRRFVNEHNNNDRQALGLAILAERRKLPAGEQAILIYDQKGVDSYHDKQRLNLSLEAKNGAEGTMWKFDTLEALAANFKMSVTDLKTTINEYNANMANDQDEFGKPKAVVKKAVDISQAPFYAMYLNPRYNYCQAGAMITPEARPLDVVSEKAIPGVFVCGEAAGGVFGIIRLTACSSLDSGVFGMIAGENAAKETPWA